MRAKELEYRRESEREALMKLVERCPDEEATGLLQKMLTSDSALTQAMKK
jgi:hypothetical protein